MAGQSQSPAGSFALTSTRPYLILAPFFVLIRPDLTGLMMVPLVTLVPATQFERTVDVHIPLAVRLLTLSSVISFSSCKVGLMISWPFLTKTFSSVFVVSSNWPFLKSGQQRVRRVNRVGDETNPNPPTSTSFVQILESSGPLKFSSRTSL